MKNPYYIAGFICAIILIGGIYAVIFIKHKKSGAGNRFDEMQLFARYQASFHAFVLLIALSVLGGIVTDLGWLCGFDAAIICIFAAITVFGCECVLRNAYFKAGEEQKSWLIVLGALAALNGVAVIRHVYDGTFMESILNLCCAIGLGTILVANFIQRGRNKRELEDE